MHLKAGPAKGIDRAFLSSQGPILSLEHRLGSS
jgi:hypothetical protein